MSSLRSILQIHPADDAIVALRTLTAGTKVSQDSQTWSLVESIPAKQKFAARDFAIGDVITMYGVKVGRATQAIQQEGCCTQRTSSMTRQTLPGSNRITPGQRPMSPAGGDRRFRGSRAKVAAQGRRIIGSSSRWYSVKIETSPSCGRR
jgi:altronate hydrolase